MAKERAYAQLYQQGRWVPAVQVPALVVAALLVASSVTALSVVATHPYPDAADPLGFSYNGVDSHLARHGSRGASFPHIVVDGVHVIDGIPDPDHPQRSLEESLSPALTDRRSRAPAVSLLLTVEDARNGTGPHGSNALAVTVRVEPLPSVEGRGALWVAVTEDVYFEPPPTVSNGVFDHRATLRAIDSKEIELSDETHMFNLSLERVTGPTTVVAWVQADGTGERFEAHEVLQSVSQAGRGQVRAVDRATLIEMRTATWCDPCLFGDRAVAALMVAPPKPASQWQAEISLLGVLGAVVGGAAFFVWGRP